MGNDTGYIVKLIWLAKNTGLYCSLDADQLSEFYVHYFKPERELF